MRLALLAIAFTLIGPGCGGQTNGGGAPSAEATASAGDAASATSASGLVYTEVLAGSGASPGPSDTVVVHYHGTFPDGRVFDSSVQRGQPARFPLNRVIPCWTEGLQKMRVGGKAKLVCPPEIAYGARGGGPIPPNATLHFEVELIDIAG
jgi:FKBP-type peptidyl-prolyl cis-trans isomerase FkpA